MILTMVSSNVELALMRTRRHTTHIYFALRELLPCDCATRLLPSSSCWCGSGSSGYGTSSGSKQVTDESN